MIASELDVVADESEVVVDCNVVESMIEVVEA